MPQLASIVQLMMPPALAERRRLVRHAVQLCVLRLEGGRYVLERVLDLSHGGLRFESTGQLLEGSAMRLVLVSPRLGIEMAVTGTVVHSGCDFERGSCVTALRFDALRSEQQAELAMLIENASVEGAAARVSSRTLQHVIIDHARCSAPIPVGAAVSVIVAALELLKRAHESTPSVIHGNLCSSEIEVRSDGTVSLNGFCEIDPTARLRPERLPYLPPELLVPTHEPTRQSDVFQMGVLLYELLTGVQPFSAPPQRLKSAVERRPALPSRLNRDVPAALARVVLDAVHVDPGQRPQGAAGLLRHLAELREPEEKARALCAKLVERVK